MIVYEDEIYLVLKFEKNFKNKKIDDEDELRYFEYWLCKKNDHPKKRKLFFTLELALKSVGIVLEKPVYDFPI